MLITIVEVDIGFNLGSTFNLTINLNDIYAKLKKL